MSPRIVKFGAFQAHLDSGELSRDGIKLKLGGQPFLVLELLLARPGEVVTREELRDAVWQSDTFVDFDHGLNTAINKIREALGDSASNPRFVETVPRRGYRFIAPVDRSVPVVEPEPVAAEPHQPASPSPAPPEKVASRKWIGVAAGAGAVALVVWLVLSQSPPPAPAGYKLTQVTRDSGLTFQPSISADGNFVVYSSDRATGKDLDIWIQHVAGGQPVRLTSSPTHESIPSISSDGRTVTFQMGYVEEERGIFVVPALGGTPRMVAAAGRDARISPDGTSVAYATGDFRQASEIHLVSVDGGADRKVATALDWAVAPMWTRDGKHLLLWSQPQPRGIGDYWMVPASGGAATKTGTAERLLRSGARSMLEVAFSHNPSPVASVTDGGLVIAARSGDGHDLWFSPLSGGEHSPEGVRITVGAGAMNPSVAANGRIAFARVSVNPGLWMLPIEASSGRVTGEMRRVWRESVNVKSPTVSADGKKLVYVSNRGGDPDVWIRDLETGADRQLTVSKVDEARALISPDGANVAFGLAGDFYTVPSSGGLQKLVCKGCGPNVVAWTPDGGKLLYYHLTVNPPRHATVDLATGNKRDVLWHPTAVPQAARLSPDGRWIMFTLASEGSRVVYVASLEDGGKPESWIRISGEGQADNSFWSPDGNLVYIHQAHALWARKLRPDRKAPIGDAFLVQRFDGPRYRSQFSAQGMTINALYFTMEETTSNIWIADPAAR